MLWRWNSHIYTGLLFYLFIVYNWIYALIIYYSENVISFFILFKNILTRTFTEDDFRTFYRVTFNFDILLSVRIFYIWGRWCQAYDKKVVNTNNSSLNLDILDNLLLAISALVSIPYKLDCLDFCCYFSLN